MSDPTVSRRKALQFIATSAAAAVVPKSARPEQEPLNRSSFTYCLNMATIRGQNLGFVKELQTASKAGFRSVEIWIDSLQAYLKTGATIYDVKKIIGDLGLKVEDLISFTEWIADDDATRNNGIEQLKMEMDLMAEIGCKRIAATGKGATGAVAPDLHVIADRYRTILQLGDKTGVVPQIEMWGFMKNLADVADVLYVAVQSGHSSAKILLDVFHLYRGNTSLNTLKLMDPLAVDILHMNDYAAGFPSETITDADRIYPGDGIAPLKQILTTLNRNGTPLVLSTEVFNKKYYARDALLVAKTSLAKMKAVVAGL